LGVLVNRLLTIRLRTVKLHLNNNRFAAQRKLTSTPKDPIMHSALAPLLLTARGFNGSATPGVLNGSPRARDAASVRSFDGLHVVFPQQAGGGSRTPKYYNPRSRRDWDVANGQIDEERKVGIECRRATPTLA
jgi:hypothetical protein